MDRIKTGGRQKGTPNKNTMETREMFKQLLEQNIDSLQSDINQLEPFQRVKVLLELAKFVVPTLKAMELKETDGGDNFKPIIIVQHPRVNRSND
jgi:hypothetical protein